MLDELKMLDRLATNHVAVLAGLVMLLAAYALVALAITHRETNWKQMYFHLDSCFLCRSGRTDACFELRMKRK